MSTFIMILVVLSGDTAINKTKGRFETLAKCEAKREAFKEEAKYYARVSGKKDTTKWGIACVEVK